MHSAQLTGAVQQLIFANSLRQQLNKHHASSPRNFKQKYVRYNNVVPIAVSLSHSFVFEVFLSCNLRFLSYTLTAAYKNLRDVLYELTLHYSTQWAA